MCLRLKHILWRCCDGTHGEFFYFFVPYVFGCDSRLSKQIQPQCKYSEVYGELYGSDNMICSLVNQIHSRWILFYNFLLYLTIRAKSTVRKQASKTSSPFCVLFHITYGSLGNFILFTMNKMCMFTSGNVFTIGIKCLHGFRSRAALLYRRLYPWQRISFILMFLVGFSLKSIL